jgi:hypothetical protein
MAFLCLPTNNKALRLPYITICFIVAFDLNFSIWNKNGYEYSLEIAAGKNLKSNYALFNVGDALTVKSGRGEEIEALIGFFDYYRSRSCRLKEKGFWASAMLQLLGMSMPNMTILFGNPHDSALAGCAI